MYKLNKTTDMADARCLHVCCRSSVLHITGQSNIRNYVCQFKVV